MKKLILLFILLSSMKITAQDQLGKASYYADKFEGQPTASGEKYKQNKLTGAHRSLPFGTKVRVTNLANNMSVEVRINDRGPYAKNRIIDLSKIAAEKLNFILQGLADVKLEILDAGDGRVANNQRPIGEADGDEKEFYSLETTSCTPRGYGIQIGIYQELVNLIRLSGDLKKSYKKKLIVQVKTMQGIKYYSLLLERFSSRAQAENFLVKVKKTYTDAYVVEFDRLTR